LKVAQKDPDVREKIRQGIRASRLAHLALRYSQDPAVVAHDGGRRRGHGDIVDMLEVWEQICVVLSTKILKERSIVSAWPR